MITILSSQRAVQHRKMSEVMDGHNM